jgi:hypothetical protein
MPGIEYVFSVPGSFPYAYFFIRESLQPSQISATIIVSPTGCGFLLHNKVDGQGTTILPLETDYQDIGYRTADDCT